jgi:hypothetical protein
MFQFIDQDEEDQAYTNAKCNERHPDGSPCFPEWDGYMFICVNRVMQVINARGRRGGV